MTELNFQEIMNFYPTNNEKSSIQELYCIDNNVAASDSKLIFADFISSNLA